MRLHSILAAAVVVLVADGFALIHAGLNRSGEPDSEVVLTNRELSYFRNADDSGVSLNLMWRDPNMAGLGFSGVNGSGEAPGVWMNEQMLRALGFDVSVPASASGAAEFYSRQLPRAAFVALENTELMDAATDPRQLRVRHLDRHSVIIVPAIIQIWLQKLPAKPAHVAGRIQSIPRALHVPVPFSAGFRNLGGKSQEGYRVHVTYGRYFEPWVTGVEFGEGR